MNWKKILIWTGVIVYLLLPIDLIPEALFGPLGYIDDAIVTFIGYKLAGGLK